jgi:hypothetical protein
MEKSKDYTSTSTAEKTVCPTVKAVRQYDFVDYKDRIVDLSGLRPDYYGGPSAPYEVFKVLEAWNIDKDFYLGNVIKYIARAGKKDSSKTKEDLEKALVYLQRRISTL